MLRPKMFLFKILKKLRLHKCVNFSTSISIGNRKHIVPLINGLGYGNLSHSEPWMLDVLKVIPVNQGVFLDVGVNIGQTLLKVKSVNENVVYYGFEPNSACIYYLQNLIQTNQWQDTHILPVAISKSVGVTKLINFNDDDTDSSASIIANFRKKTKSARESFISILNYQSVVDSIGIGKVKTIKIDVEGAELDVMTSLYSLLQNDRPYIIIEILPVYNSQNTERYSRQLEIEKLAHELAYNIFRIEKLEGKLTSFKKIDAIGIHDDISLCDYILEPIEEEKSIAKPL